MRGSKREKRPGIWELRVYAGKDPETGKDRYVSRTVRGGVRKAESELAALVRAAERGEFSTKAGTFGHLLDEWMRIVERDRSPLTARGYATKIDVWLKPHLGEVRLEELTARHFDRLYRTMTDAGKAPSTIRQTHAIAHRALAQAVRWEWLDRNPAGHATPPTVPRREVDPPPIAHLAQALREYADVNPDMAALWWMSAALGSRRGEAVGLQWRDIDFGRSEVLVARSVYETRGGGWGVKDTKTRASRRVRLDEGTLAVLLVHRQRCEERARRSLVELPDAGFVFSPDPGAGEPFRPDRVTKTWRRWADANGLEGARLHDVRHLAASVLLDAGVPLHTVSRRLGHARSSTTLDIYAHVLPGADDLAAEVMGRALGSG